MKQVAGIEMVHVPYKGTAPALADLVSGNIQMLIDAPIGVISNVRAGKVRALCMLSKERVPGVEEVPTIVEAGGPPIEGSSWVMFLAPAGTPKEIVDRLQGEVAKAMKDEGLRKRFAELAVIPAGATPADTAKFLNDEIEKWGKVITTAGVKVDSRARCVQVESPGRIVPLAKTVQGRWPLRPTIRSTVRRPGAGPRPSRPGRAMPSRCIRDDGRRSGVGPSGRLKAWWASG